eukprot:6477612-Amphidinium_carterae.1
MGARCMRSSLDLSARGHRRPCAGGQFWPPTCTAASSWTAWPRLARIAASSPPSQPCWHNH